MCRTFLYLAVSIWRFMTLFKKNSNITDLVKHYDSPMAFAMDLIERAIKEIPDTPENQRTLVDVVGLTLVALEDYKEELAWINA